MVTPPRFQCKSNLTVVLLNFLSDFLKETRDFISPSLHRKIANRSPLSPERASVARRGWLPAYVRNAVFSPHHHRKRCRGISMALHQASHMRLYGSDALVLRIFKHAPFICLQERFLGFARNDDTRRAFRHSKSNPMIRRSRQRLIEILHSFLYLSTIKKAS